MNTEQTSENIFTYIKTHYGETILAKIRKLEKTMIKYSSYTNHLLIEFVFRVKKWLIRTNVTVTKLHIYLDQSETEFITIFIEHVIGNAAYLVFLF